MWLKANLILALGFTSGYVYAKVSGWWFFIPLVAASFVCMWMDQTYGVTLKKEEK